MNSTLSSRRSFLKTSALGAGAVAWRATVSDPAMAESFGVSVIGVRYLNFLIASLLATWHLRGRLRVVA